MLTEVERATIIMFLEEKIISLKRMIYDEKKLSQKSKVIKLTENYINELETIIEKVRL